MKVLNSETHRVEPGLIPQDVFGGVDSARLDMVAAKANGLMILVEMGTGTGSTFDITLQQHNLAAAGTSKDLVPLKVLHKIASATSYTDQAPLANVLVPAMDTEAGVVLLEVYLDDLDTENDFNWISVNVAASGSARAGSLSYHTNAKHQPAHANVI